MRRDDELLNPAAPGFQSPAVATATATATAQSPGGDPTLKSDSILIAAFTYASGSAHEAVEDRSRLFDRYLLIFGGVFVSGATAVFQLNQIGARNFVYPLTIAALAFTGLLGVAFYLTFIRLRQAFVDALIEMAKIKEYYLYVLRYDDPKLGLAFDWKLRTVRGTDRMFTVSYLMAHIVATLDSFCLAGAVFVGAETHQNKNSGNLLSLPHTPVPYVLATVVFLAVLTAQLTYYRARCRGLTAEDRDALIKRLHEEVR
jgi:hypothetical protein